MNSTPERDLDASPANDILSQVFPVAMFVSSVNDDSPPGRFRFLTRHLVIHCLLVWIGLPSLTCAHVVQQIFAEIKQEGPDWQVEVLFDAGYADPIGRGDATTPQPTRDWLVAMDSREQQNLRRQSADYLSECLGFSDIEGPVGVTCHFVDFDRSPPDFPELLTNGAYLRILISPARPRPVSELRCSLSGGVRPDFVFKTLPGESGDSGYLTLRPGESFILWEGSSHNRVPANQVTARPPLVHAFQEGFLHVIPDGTDHLLFVIGLFLLRRKWKPLLWQSLAFTCAHTLTLGLAAAGVIAPRSEWVEPLIALSIAFLAIENLFCEKLSPWRLPLVFAFGLVHGMGFATALATLLTPGGGFLPRLIAANVGVEFAQVTALAGAWLLTIGWSSKPAYQTLRKWANVSLAAIALWWFFERVF